MGFLEDAARELSGTNNAQVIVGGLLMKTRYAARKELDYWAKSMADSEWRGLLRVLDARARDSRDMAQADLAADLIGYCESLQ